MTAEKYVKLFFISSLCLLILSSCGFDGDYVSKMGDRVIHVSATTAEDDRVVLPLLGMVSLLMLLVVVLIPIRFKLLFSSVVLFCYVVQHGILQLVSFDPFWHLAADTVVYGKNGGMLCWMICFGLYTLSALVVMVDLLFPFRLWGRRAGVGQS
jgi:hypothetical protein